MFMYRGGDLFSEVGDEVLVRKFKIARASFTVWGPKARLTPPMGSKGKALGGGVGAKPPEALGFTAYSMQDTA